HRDFTIRRLSPVPGGPLMKRLSALLLGSVLALGTAQAAERPPRDLHLVGDHWTAWNPPVPPPGAEVYTIVRGDTLWDLANRFTGNPYLWPQLWELNQYILDAHWIYPGDPLAMLPKVAPAQSLAADSGAAGTTVAGGEVGDATTVAAAPTPAMEGVQTSIAAAGAPQPLGSESDIYCTGYIGEAEEAFPYRIIGSEFENQTPHISGRGKVSEELRPPVATSYGVLDGETAKYGLSTGDILYIDGGRAKGLTPGSLFTAVRPGAAVRHPVFDDVLGRFYQYLGRVRVLSVQDDTAIGEIVSACDPIPVGSWLQPFEEEPVPLGRRTGMRPVNFPASAGELEGAPAI